MSVNVLRAAKFSCKFYNWEISHLRLQKILYIAHMCHLGQTEGDPLIDGDFEAWDYGPVHPVLYRKAKIFGADPVGNIFRSFPEIEDGTEKETLVNALKVLKGFSSTKLVALTHREEGAWAKNYHPGESITIPNEDIIQEYYGLVKAGIIKVAAA